jgi:hypothetical protein
MGLELLSKIFREKDRNKSRRSGISHYFHDDHVGHPHVHLPGVANIGAVEVTQLLLEDLLGYVHLGVGPHLDHAIVHLQAVHFAYNFAGLDAASAALLLLVGSELTPMGRGVQDVEDVAEGGSVADVHPAEPLASSQETVVSSFWFVTSSVGHKAVAEPDGFISISEILDSEQSRIAVVMVGHDCETKRDSFSHHLALDLMNQRLDRRLHLRQLRSHRAGCI